MSDDDFSDSDGFIVSDESDDYKSVKKTSKSTTPANSTTSKTSAKATSTKKSAAKKSSTPTVVMDDEPALAPPKPTSSKPKTIEETYTKMEHHQHILERPDTYIGSTRRVAADDLWIWDDALQAMVQRKVTYAPGLLKIFDEIMVNAADNFQRDSSMTFIKVTIDEATGTISVHNDGDGIPVELHKQHKQYVPELIFGDLLTGSSFDDSVDKVTGGRNGLGAKLANIYSVKFIIETVCKGKSFKQVFTRNMYDRAPAVVTSTSSKDYTKITFVPDLKRFDGMTELDADILGLFKKRVYDVAGCNSKLKVYLNGQLLKIRSFKDYVDLYFKYRPVEAPTSEEEEPSTPPAPTLVGPEVILDKDGRKRWEIIFALSNGEPGQVSFVNSIWTMRGGTHVTYILNRLVAFLGPKISRQNKGTEVKPAMIKNHIFIFVNALISNPEFDSQSKETLKSTQNLWGCKCEMSENFLNKIAKSGIINQILNWNLARSQRALQTTGGKRRQRLGITKLTDANNAATSKSSRCTLIITEGDSAKGLAAAGLSVVGRDNYGIFALRGKLPNVRETDLKKVVDNEELNTIKQAMGLQHFKEYKDVSELRYGHIMIMTDQDHDGSHIKGLFINFIHHYWPSLLKIPGFLTEFITPIVKATKGDRTVSFFTIPQYQEWRNSTNIRGWTIKYYKGLGTSLGSEMQEYFSDLPKHKKDFVYTGPQDDTAIKLAFAKENSDGRKEWLASYKPGNELDQSLTRIPYHDFVHKELILFSMEDCARSIASMVDGLKPAKRKILHACFRRNLKGDIKIVQLGGYVLEHCAYHHGETSLYGTIIGMAHNFVGSNNINLLEPVGNFGSRDQGGKDAAAARYIFTSVAPLARYLFHPDDDSVLKYLEDDGLPIEPTYYVPIVPSVLINGNRGIGTGWASTVPCFNPRDIVRNIRALLQNEPVIPMHPWYRGFQGTIEYDEAKSNYRVKGVWRRLDDESFEITELPLGTWTQSYKEFLEELYEAYQDKQNATKKEQLKKKKKEGTDGAEEMDVDDDFGKKKGGSANGKKKTKGIGVDGSRDKGYINVRDYKEYHTATRVRFVVFCPDIKDMSDQAIEKTFELTSTLAITNMYLFDADGQIKKYPTAEEILKDFFIVRYQYYEKRKAGVIASISHDMKVLDNRARFIKIVIDKQLVVIKKKKKELIAELRAKKFDPIPKESKKSIEFLPEGIEETDDIDKKSEIDDADMDDETDNFSSKKKPKSDDDDKDSRDYDYLLSMPIWSLTYEKYMKLLEQLEEKKHELSTMEAVHPADLWERDLNAFEMAWDRFEFNMNILDEQGVGGIAFRKPTSASVQPKNKEPDSKARGAQASAKEERARAEARTKAFKLLQKLPPVKQGQQPPTPVPDRKPILLPDVKTDSVIPAAKVKREKVDPSLMGSTAPTETVQKAKKKTVVVGSDQVKREVVQVKKEAIKPEPESPPRSQPMTLAERLAARAKFLESSPEQKPNIQLNLDSSDEDIVTVTHDGYKKRAATQSTASTTATEIDSDDDSLNLLPQQTLKKLKTENGSKPTAVAKSKSTTNNKKSSRFMSDDDEGDLSDFIVSDDDEELEFESNEEEDDSLPNSPIAPMKRAKRTAAPKSIAKDDIDSEDEFNLDAGSDSEDESPVKTKPPAKRLGAKKSSSRTSNDDSDGFTPKEAPKRLAKKTSKKNIESSDEFQIDDS